MLIYIMIVPRRPLHIEIAVADALQTWLYRIAVLRRPALPAFHFKKDDSNLLLGCRSDMLAKFQLTCQ